MGVKELLELQASMLEDGEITEMSCPHGDTCRICRERRLAATVAKEMLDRGDHEDNSALRRWAEEFERRRRQLPNLN